MPDQYVMAIDAGTGSCRAILFNRDGDQVATHQEEWSHRSLPEYPGSQVFDTKSNWELISKCIRGAISNASAEPSDVKGVSATSMREGMVLYDEAGKEIWACPNVDSRATKEAAGLIRSGAAKRIFREGGDWVSITAPPRFLWIRKNQPDVFRRIGHVGMLSDWILYRLSDKFATDPSVGSSSGMFDLGKRRWSKRTAELCGLEPDIFPEVMEPGSTLGEVTQRAAEETGLREGTPVVLGGADTQLGLIGMGTSEKGEAAVVGGSFWQTTIALDRPLIDGKMRLRSLCHAYPGMWMMEGIGFYSGLTLRWFRDGFCESEKEEAKRRGVDPYVLMEELASRVPPGSNGVLGIFGNIMDSKRWVHASPSLLQFRVGDPANSGKKESIRAIEESAAYVVQGHLRIIESITGRRMGSIMFAGGGSKGKVWPQIIADVLGIDVKIPLVKESTSLGCAICAGTGTGWYDDLRSGSKELSRVERTLSPNATNHEAYLELYKRWAKVYARSLAMAEDGLLEPLWWPAGA
ncbi:MAG TPA: autoinducer-2 kinase [Nitrososphaerales archaeon]|nr:autoinducer-2 kinase [Nitrososphaerales archaeon]